MKVNVLGTEYTITECIKADNPYMTNCDGYCDKTSKTIAIAKKPDDCDLDDFEVYRKQVLRHEIIHAFLNESGMQECFEHANRFGHEETMVDWIAIQFPKMIKAFEEAGCL